MCPDNGNFQPGSCCVPIERPNFNMEGEFYRCVSWSNFSSVSTVKCQYFTTSVFGSSGPRPCSHGKTDWTEGGHAMLLVGYNDNFVTTDGSVGGFILKNNWASGRYTVGDNPRGSHSVEYFMQEHSRCAVARVHLRLWRACLLNCSPFALLGGTS